MRAVFGLVLVVGMGLAGFAVYMVNGYVAQTQSELDEERQRAAEAVPTVQVYAVNRPMKYGETLTQDDVVLIDYAEPFLPEGVFSTEEELFPCVPSQSKLTCSPVYPASCAPATVLMFIGQATCGLPVVKTRT